MYKPPSLNVTLSALLAVLLVGCASRQLVPAPEAPRVPGNPDAATAASSGVRLTVESDAWTGKPSTLEREMTPLRVTIENQSEQPLRIRYNEFKLETPTGDEFAAIPPFEIEGSARVQGSRPIYVPRFAHSRFYLAPWYSWYYSPYYVDLRPWYSPWTFDRFYYDRYYPTWEVQLPTRDMRERAIPEGVIEPGGSVSGFLYFRRMPQDVERVTFTADLMNGVDGNGFGALRVPFVMG